MNHHHIARVVLLCVLGGHLQAASPPVVDLSRDTARHVIIAQGTKQVYQGHPTTLLLPDGKTMLCVWTHGHGGTAGPLKKSDDGGRTWSEELPVPESWRTVKNSPAIYRLTDPHGVARLIGLTNIRRPGEKKDPRSNVVAQSESTDGRLVIAFRDMGKDSPTRTHFVAWVGRSEDILGGTDGGYNIELLHSHAGGDSGHPGLEVLPDGTLVASTYITYRSGPEKHSAVSTRFRLQETDRAETSAAASPAAGKTLGMVRAESPRAVHEADVCVFGGTSGGVAAAVQAARMGKTVILAEPGRHLGGMTSGGLSAVDIGDPRSVGGIAREYFTRLAATAGVTLAWDREFEAAGGGPATGGAYAIEPHKAEQVFADMVQQAGVKVHFNARLAAVKKDGPRLTELVMENGDVFRARVFLDTTYEGDLMAKAGVSYTLTREGRQHHGESLAGIIYEEKYCPRAHHPEPGPHGRVPGGQGVWDRDFPLDPYRVKGEPKSGLLPLVDGGDPGKPGDPAPGIQAYCYRLCLTTNPANMIPISPPADYDPQRYELVARFVEACRANGDDMDLRWFSKHDPLPNDKWDFNTATFGGNLPGASHAWPEASYAQRETIARAHEDYHRGLLHFLATDPRVPEKVRRDMRRFGLPRDEFTDNGGWPHQIYVRQGRRMVSDFVMTEHHICGRRPVPKAIGLGSYGIDVHEIRRIVKDGVVAREGKIATVRDGAPPYSIGYDAIVPKRSECENLLVPFAMSCSHIAFASIRMEPVFMVTSQSAATAACQSIDDGTAVQEVDYERLAARLRADHQVLTWPPQ